MNEIIPVEETKELENQTELLHSEIDQARIELEYTKKLIEEKRAELKCVGRDAQEQKVLDNQLHTIVKNDGLKDKIERQKAYDDQPVTGKFLNRRAPGQAVKLPYVKYSTDVVKWWPFRDGGTYTIPRGFADQINEHYHTPQFIQKEGALDPNDPNQIANVDTSNKKYAFVAVGY